MSGIDGCHMTKLQPNRGGRRKAVGMEGISKSHRAAIHRRQGRRRRPRVPPLRGDRQSGAAFLTRPSEGEWPYIWLDATYVKARRGNHLVSVAVIVAVGVNTDGRREALGMTIGRSEAEADVLASMDFPAAHRVKQQRRSDVVGIPPDAAAVSRLIAAPRDRWPPRRPHASVASRSCPVRQVLHPRGQ